MSHFRNPLLSFWPGTWLLVFAFAGHAQFIFTTNSNNTITITGFAGSNSLVAIPAMINGYPVSIFFALCVRQTKRHGLGPAHSALGWESRGYWGKTGSKIENLLKSGKLILGNTRKNQVKMG